jgi:hypothetical protein
MCRREAQTQTLRLYKQQTNLEATVLLTAATSAAQIGVPATA